MSQDEKQDLKRMPPQTMFIVGNEACERFSYYGVISILTGYATVLYGGDDLAKAHAKETVHWFKMACYLMPLLGAWIADRFWGRYHTILWLSLAYCVGHALLAVGEGTGWGLFAGLAFIAIGSGGIKPCVSAFAGDQFSGGREHLVGRIYNWFYWSVNFGSFFAFLYIPRVAESSYRWAFGLPGIAMGIAALIFWLGRTKYIRIPPSREVPKLDEATREADRRTLWRIIGIFAVIPFFWSIFDQQNTTWVQQGKVMKPFLVFGQKFDGETMQSINPILVMVIVPLFALLLYPGLARTGLKVTSLRRMGCGFFLGAASFLAAASVQAKLDAHQELSVACQFWQYVLLTAGEVLMSTTGLAFAFTQAPPRLKSTIMSFWYLAVALGNAVTAGTTRINAEFVQATPIQELYFYAALVTVAGFVFIFIAQRFPTRGED
jgi:POT family proton-dependent oligopeptide transporter